MCRRRSAAAPPLVARPAVALAARLAASALAGWRPARPTTRSLWFSSLLHSPAYSAIVVAVLFSSVITAGWEPPAAVTLEQSGLAALRAADAVFLLVAVTDTVVQALAVGGIRVAARRGWTRVKAVALLALACNLIAVLARQSPYPARALRPLFILERLPSVRRVARNIAGTALAWANVMILLSFHVLFFTVLGFVLFAGVDGTNCTPFRGRAPVYCSTFENPAPCTDYFSSLENAAMQLFQFLTGANYPSLALPAWQCARASALYFVAFQVIGVYILLALTLAVTVDAFTRLMADEVIVKFRRRFEGLDLAFSALVGAPAAADEAAAVAAVRAYPEDSPDGCAADDDASSGGDADARVLPRDDFVGFMAALRPDVPSDVAGAFFDAVDPRETGLISRLHFRRIVSSLRAVRVRPSRGWRHAERLRAAEAPDWGARSESVGADGDDDWAEQLASRDDVEVFEALRAGDVVSPATSASSSFRGLATQWAAGLSAAAAAALPRPGLEATGSGATSPVRRTISVSTIVGNPLASAAAPRCEPSSSVAEASDRAPRVGALRSPLSAAAARSGDAGAGSRGNGVATEPRPIVASLADLPADGGALNGLQGTEGSGPSPLLRSASAPVRSAAPPPLPQQRRRDAGTAACASCCTRLLLAATSTSSTRDGRAAPMSDVVPAPQRRGAWRHAAVTACRAPLTTLAFDGCVLLNTVAVLVQLSLEDDAPAESGGDVPYAGALGALRVVKWFTFAVFCAEIGGKAALWGPRAYWRDSAFHRLDLALLGAAVCGAVLGASGARGVNSQVAAALGFLRSVRLLRTARAVPGFGLTAAALADIVPALASYFGVLLAAAFSFAIVGMEAFGSGAMGRDVPAVAVSSYGLTDAYSLNFDTLPGAFACLFYLIVMNDWPILMEGATAAVGKLARFYFFAFWLIGCVLCLNVAVAFVIDGHGAASEMRSLVARVAGSATAPAADEAAATALPAVGVDDWRRMLRRAARPSVAVALQRYTLSTRAADLDVHDQIFKGPVRAAFARTFAAGED